MVLVSHSLQMLPRLLHLTRECPSASALLLLSLSFAEANSVSSLHCTCMHWDLHLLKLKNTTFGEWTCQSKLAKYPVAVHVEYVVVKVALREDFFKLTGRPCESSIHPCAIQIHCILDAVVPHRQSLRHHCCCYHHHHHEPVACLVRHHQS